MRRCARGEASALHLVQRPVRRLEQLLTSLAVTGKDGGANADRQPQLLAIGSAAVGNTAADQRRAGGVHFRRYQSKLIPADRRAPPCPRRGSRRPIAGLYAG
jgi:hypothetical protein